MVNLNFEVSGYIPSYNLNFGTSYILLNILNGTSENFISIHADVNASINTAKVYITTSGEGAALSIVDLSRGVLTDNYLIDYEGGFKESLDREDIVDVNISISGD